MAALLGEALAAQPATDSDGLARCAAIAEAGSRLVCYDALAHRPADRPTAAATTAAPPPAAAYPPTAQQAPITAPAPVAPVAPVATVATAENFGLSPAQVRPVATGPSAIQARISSISAGQPGVGHPTVVLDNGQVWAFSEALDDPRLSPGAPVTIKRAALGSFLLTTASQHRYHVHRIQ
jgi:hypothetical protein